MGKVLSSDGTVIAYDRTGAGPPLILVGGALSDRSGAAPMAQLLAPRLTVFGYDRRGRGDSGDTLPYAPQREIEDLHALITEAGGSAYVYGMSSGAALALEAAASGLPITRLAVYEPPYTTSGGPTVAQLNELIAAGRPGDAIELFMTEAAGIPTELIAQMRQSPMWQGMEAVAHTIAYDFTILGDATVPADRFAAIAVPTLVLDGGASPAWAANSTDAVAAAIPGAQRHTLPGQTHAVSPDALAAELIPFFAT